MKTAGWSLIGPAGLFLCEFSFKVHSFKIQATKAQTAVDEWLTEVNGWYIGAFGRAMNECGQIPSTSHLFNRVMNSFTLAPASRQPVRFPSAISQCDFPVRFPSAIF